MNKQLFVSTKPINEHFSFFDLSGCDTLSKLNVSDLNELLNEIERTHLVFRALLGIDKYITFGEEIEYEGARIGKVSYALLKLIKHNIIKSSDWVSKDDSTVSLGGFTGGEVTTPILTDTKENWIDFYKVFEMLNNEMAISGNKSSNQVHCGIQILENNLIYWKNMIKLWIIFEKIIYRFGYGERIGPRCTMNYALPTNPYLLKNLEAIDNSSNLSDFLSCFTKCNRQVGLNLNNVKLDESIIKNTIELRPCNSTINPIIGQNNINFFVKFLLYCKSNSFNYDYIEKKLKNIEISENLLSSYNQIYLQDVLEFVDLIFTNNLDKIYFLKQYIKDFQIPTTKEDNMKTFIL